MRARLQKLREVHAQLEAQLEALKSKIAGVRLAIDVLGGCGDDDDRPGKLARGTVKETLFQLLQEAGKTGIKSHGAVEMARLRGIWLDPNTVRSTLSRMKRDGAVDYDGQRYRLKGAEQRELRVVSGAT